MGCPTKDVRHGGDAQGKSDGCDRSGTRDRQGIAPLTAREGAKVVVYELCGGGDNTGSERGPADAVAAEMI
jgi:hypothetical protein